MTKFKAGLRYELLKLLKHIVLFIVGAVAFLGLIQLMFLPFTGIAGFGSVGFSNVYSFVFLFLIFWTAIVFGRDAGLFLQSGLTRRAVFVIFVLTVVAEALVFALLDAALSLMISDVWSKQSFLLSGSYTLTVFCQLFLVNLAVASFALFVAALKSRIGTRWTALLFIVAFMLVTVALPYCFSLFPGGIEAYSMFMASLMGSPYAPAMHFMFQAVVALACIALTWALIRRISVDRFAAGK